MGIKISKNNKQTTSLLPNEITDFQNLTSFSNDILIKLHNHYKKFSSHLTDDGVIDYSEFIQIMNKDQNMSKRIFNAVDINKDGVINFREFLKYISCFINGTFEEKINLSFKLFADDKKKTINKESLINLLKDVISEESNPLKLFFENEIENLVNETFRVIKSENIKKTDNSLSNEIDLIEYSQFIKINPIILNWLIVDLEKIRSERSFSGTELKKHHKNNKIICFGN